MWSCGRAIHAKKKLSEYRHPYCEIVSKHSCGRVVKATHLKSVGRLPCRFEYCQLWQMKIVYLGYPWYLNRHFLTQFISKKCSWIVTKLSWDKLLLVSRFSFSKYFVLDFCMWVVVLYRLEKLWNCPSLVRRLPTTNLLLF